MHERRGCLSACAFIDFPVFNVDDDTDCDITSRVLT